MSVHDVIFSCCVMCDFCHIPRHLATTGWTQHISHICMMSVFSLPIQPTIDAKVQLSAASNVYDTVYFRTALHGRTVQLTMPTSQQSLTNTSRMASNIGETEELSLFTVGSRMTGLLLLWLDLAESTTFGSLLKTLGMNLSGCCAPTCWSRGIDEISQTPTFAAQHHIEKRVDDQWAPC